MVVNNALSGNTPVTIALANFRPGATAQVWQLTSANAIARLADVAVTGTSIAVTLLPQSISLFVIPSSNVLTSPAPPTNVRIKPAEP
jgi:hypothetical protein